MLAVTAAAAGCSDRKADYTGIWKVDCADDWAVQITPADGGLYSVTFCGLTGCIRQGEWMPDTRIEGDASYEVLSSTELRIKRHDGGHFTYRKCSDDPFWLGG